MILVIIDSFFVVGSGVCSWMFWELCSSVVGLNVFIFVVVLNVG